MSDARSARRADWIFYALGGLPGAALALSAASGIVPERWAMAAFALSFIGLNLAHNAATWSRVYLDPAGLRGALAERVGVPAALVGAALLGDALGGTALLLAAQYYLSIHHGGMQNYGILRAGQRRAGRAPGAVEVRIAQAACVLGPVAALCWRARSVCREYDGVLLAAPPLALTVLLSIAGAAALVVFLVGEWAAHRRGEPVDPLGVALVAGTSIGWSAVLVSFRHPALPLYAIASGHYLQYTYFVWRFEHARPGLRYLPVAVRERIAPPARLAYLAALGGLGAGVVVVLTALVITLRHLTGAPAGDRALVPSWTAAMIGVNLAHYWLDRKIWRTPVPAPAPAAASARAEHFSVAQG